MLYDFHTHTYLSDGVLSPVELIRRACVREYTAIAVTDHVGLWGQERVLEILVRECEMATAEMGILAIPGVELTHVPPAKIHEAATRARSLGAQIVICHGESIVEPVAEGTNRAALESPEVDVLAHPGLLSEEEARLAVEGGTILELSARRGHSLTNGHVASLGRAVGAHMVVDSDAHAPEDLLTESLAEKIARGAGLRQAEAATVLRTNPEGLISRLGVAGKLPIRAA